jgi:hypothetical protein
MAKTKPTTEVVVESNVVVEDALEFDEQLPLSAPENYEPNEPDYKSLLLALLVTSPKLGRNATVANETLLNAKDGKYKLTVEFDPFTLKTILRADHA